VEGCGARNVGDAEGEVDYGGSEEGDAEGDGQAEFEADVGLEELCAGDLLARASCSGSSMVGFGVGV
jgi:hypothetical protein